LWHDDEAGLFHYVWKAPTAVTGCVTLVLTTADGSTLSALFLLK
jgi:hypothetical protein